MCVFPDTLAKIYPRETQYANMDTIKNLRYMKLIFFLKGSKGNIYFNIVALPSTNFGVKVSLHLS